MLPHDITETSDGSKDDGLSAREVWGALRKHWVILVVIAVGVTLLATFYAMGQTKVYRAASTIQIDPTPPKPLGNDVQSVDVGAGAYWANKEYYETQYKIIASRRVALLTVRALGLQHDSAFLENALSSSSDANVTPEEAAEVLRSRVHVEPEKDSRLVIVSFEDADPSRAQRIVSALVDTYIRENLDSALSSNQSSGDWLRGQLSKLKKELETSELKLHEYKRDKNILSMSMDDQSNMLREEMRQLNEALTGVRARQEKISARKSELQKISADNPTDLPARELLESQVLQQLRGDYVAAKRDEQSLLQSGKGPNHPDVRAAAARTAVTRKALLAEISNIKRSVDRDLDAAKREVRGLSHLYEAAKRKALNVNLLEIEYKRLERSKKNTEKLYSLVLERSKESELAGLMRFNNIRVVDSALVPTKPVRPNIPFSAGVGLLVGLAIGFASALARELLDRSIKTAADVERELDTSLLGTLPKVDSSDSGYGSYGPRHRRLKRSPASDAPPELVVHTHPTSAVAEAARAMRTNILFMSPDKPFTRLLVTSAAPSEGKTTVACCLATAMAQAGHRVLLIDCDLRRPRLHKIFRKRNDIGITTGLLDRTLLATADLSTDVEHLSVLPAGPSVPNPAEIIQSTSFARLLDHVQADYDRVVIDSPPLIPVTDAAVLSSLVDGTVVVVRAFKTSKDVGRHALRSLRAVGSRIVGVVLNLVESRSAGYGYYYHYYGSSTDGEDGARAAAE